MGQFPFVARAVAIMAALMFCRFAPAADVAWTGGAGTGFESNGNWSTGAAPGNDLLTDSAVLGSPTGAMPELTISRQIYGLNLQQAGWTVGGTGNALTIGAGGIGSAGPGASTLLHDVTAGLPQTWCVGGGNTLRAAGVVSSGAGNVILKSGTGTLSLANAANALAGGIQIAQGTVRAEAAGALGSGAVNLAGGTLSMAGVGGVVMPAGLLAWYTFDPSTVTGSNVADISGNHHDATFVNFGAGAIADGVFDTHSDQSKVQMPDMATNFGNAGSIVLWLKNDMATNTDRNETGFAAGLEGYPVDSTYPWIDGYGRFSTFRSALGPKVTLSATVDRAQWHMVAITMDGATKKWNLYQNDTRVVTDDTSASWSIASANWGLGSYITGPAHGYDGWIDNVSLYTRALTGPEVLGLYAAGRTPAVNDNYGNNISVTADSTIDVDPPGKVSLGSLTLDGPRTLAFTGGGTVSFSAASLAVGTTHATLNVAGGMTLRTGLMNDAGQAATWSKTGTGTWILDDPGNALAVSTLAIADGKLQVDSAAGLGGASVCLSGGGRLVSAGGLSVAGSFTGSGTISLADGAGTLTLNPGAARPSAIKGGGEMASPGVLWVEGNLTFGATTVGRAKVQANVARSVGSAGVGYDQLNVTGNADLGNAQLEVSLPLPSAQMSLAGTFTDVILTAGSITGTFASVVAGPLTNSRWDIASALSYDATNNRVTITLGRANWRVHDGDANLDNRVESMDLTTLATHWRTRVADWAGGDFNYDGSVDSMDLTVLANNWRWSGPAGSGSVPEPAGLALMAWGLLAAVRRGRKKKIDH